MSGRVTAPHPSPSYSVSSPSIVYRTRCSIKPRGLRPSPPSNLKLLLPSKSPTTTFSCNCTGNSGTPLLSLLCLPIVLDTRFCLFCKFPLFIGGSYVTARVRIEFSIKKLKLSKCFETANSIPWIIWRLLMPIGISEFDIYWAEEIICWFKKFEFIICDLEGYCWPYAAKSVQ